MAFLEDKIDEIRDPKLRSAILQEIKKLKSEKKFGLVFEEHLPELAPIYSTSIRPGAIVARKTGSLAETYTVTAVQNQTAALVKDADGSEIELALAELMAVKRFGEAIYPALIPLDRLETDPTAPYHTLIEADNYHALQLLEYAYAGKVDVIYIDPPYNTGARDWKYNNRYVDNNDRWRHSKWLSMMRKRLILARRLLKSDTGVLIVTIDEHEIHHLRMLLDECFQEMSTQMVTAVINPKGVTQGRLSRVEEYIIFCFQPYAQVTGSHDDLLNPITNVNRPRWKGLLRSGDDARRQDRENMFYPVLVDKNRGAVLDTGKPLPINEMPNFDETQDGLTCVWPVRADNSLGRWGVGHETLQKLINKGYVSLGRYDEKRRTFGITYLSQQSQNKIEDGTLRIINFDAKRNVIDVVYAESVERKIKTVWHRSTHDAGAHGADLLSSVLGQPRAFSFPKSLYSVRDTLACVVGNNNNALILDFFSGSGTTLHATLLLNAADGGNRQCILVTDNEVSENEARQLSAQGYQPNDPEWEAHGICRSVTFPRCKYVIQGKRDDGTELEGEYLTGRTLTKEKPRTFRKIGFIHPATLTDAARKRELVSLIEGIPQNAVSNDTAFFVSAQHTASILFYPSQAEAYLEALEGQEHITHFYLVTPTNKTFNDLKQAITDLLGPVQAPEEEKLPMKNGFSANLEYFKLEFLDPHEVEMGRQFAAILPILWLMAGATGPRPYSSGDVPYLIPAGNPFAVLLDEAHFRPFKALIEPRSDLSHIFLVTDSEDAFFDMKAELDSPNLIMLYKSYLQNFKINTQRP